MAENYLQTVYNEKRTPKTNYPDKLVAYLSKRYKLVRGQSLLEIGCGRGDFLLAFKRAGFQCAGVDREVLPELATQVEVKRADISQALPYPDNSFDIIYHKSVIEHVYSPEKLMKESLRVLKPGGVLIILTPDWITQMKVFYEDITHCRPYDTTALADAYTLHGFTGVKTEVFYQLPILWKFSLLKMFAWPFRFFVSVRFARTLTKLTGIKFFRWSSELMVLGSGKKN